MSNDVVAAESTGTPERSINVPITYSLSQTCAPVSWGRGRWASVDWIDGALYSVGLEASRVTWRRVRQPAPGTLIVDGDRDPSLDESWLNDCLGVSRIAPKIDDPVISEIADRYPGLRPHCSGSLFAGVISCIAGQSITVAAAAITEARIFGLFHPGISINGRTFWPAPDAADVASAQPALVRTSGVTWKRAEAIVHAAKAQLAGELPSDEEARSNVESARTALRKLPLVGPWTAESALLWGLGLDDIFPPSDAALLRAARRSYGLPVLDHKGLERLSESWRPGRAWAARWLWIDLLGAPATS